MKLTTKDITLPRSHEQCGQCRFYAGWPGNEQYCTRILNGSARTITGKFGMKEAQQFNPRSVCGAYEFTMTDSKMSLGRYAYIEKER